MNTPTPAGVQLSAPEQGLAKERRVILQADRVMRVYIAGPMTGLPEFNFPAFNAMAEVLRADGWHVENPAEHGHVDGAEWADYLRYDISRLSTCSAMMLLPGWSSSRGARLEVSIAKELGHEMLYAVGAEQMPSDFDRVTAERDALQQRLTAVDERADALADECEELRALLDAPTYPNRLCHVDYTAHPYICGGFKGDEEAQRRYDEKFGKPAAQPQGEPVYQVSDGVNGWSDVDLLRYTACCLDPEEYECRILYAEQPAPVAAIFAIPCRKFAGNAVEVPACRSDCPCDTGIPDFTPGNGNKARRRAAAIEALKPENQRITPIDHGTKAGFCDCNQGRLPCTCKPSAYDGFDNGVD